MRLHVRKKGNYSYYSIIMDYTKLNGKRSTRIYEKLGNQNQVEERFGKDNTIDKIKDYIKTINVENKEELLKREYNPNKRIQGNIKRNFNVGYLFLEKIYYDLKLNEICNEIQEKYKFKFNLNEVLSYLVYARIIYPSSKLETYKQCQNFLESPQFKLHDEYRALSYLSQNMDLIQEKLFENSKKIIDRNNKVVYYDCTNFFFEINEEDDLRKYGVSKEHRPNPIVGMGMFMDGDGLPLSLNVYPGNLNEQKTLIPEENKIINNFKLDDTKIVLCTDAGLASDEIKKFNVKDGRAFVITQSLKKLKDEYKNKIFDKSDWRISDDLYHTYNLDEIANNEKLKDKYYDTIFYKIVESETKSVKQDIIVTFCFKYFDYSRNIRNSQIERARKAITSGNITRKGKNQNDYRRFLDENSFTETGEPAESKTYSINEKLIEEEEKYDGFYALSTNLVGNISEILKIVKGRWEIEESFRIMKTDFKSRPVELSREDRIKAHFMTCFISLLIYRILEKKLNNKYTTSEILKTIRNMNVIEQKGLGYEPIYERTNITDDLHSISSFWTDYEIISYKKIKKIFKQISKWMTHALFEALKKSLKPL